MAYWRFGYNGKGRKKAVKQAPQKPKKRSNIKISKGYDDRMIFINELKERAINIANHVNRHHEVSLINNFIEKLGKNYKPVFRNWFIDHAKADYDEATDLFKPSRRDVVPAIPKTFVPRGFQPLHK